MTRKLITLHSKGRDLCCESLSNTDNLITTQKDDYLVLSTLHTTPTSNLIERFLEIVVVESLLRCIYFFATFAIGFLSEFQLKRHFTKHIQFIHQYFHSVLSIGCSKYC